MRISVDEGQEPFPGAKMLGDQGLYLDCVVVCYFEEVVESNQRKAKVNKRVKTARVVIEDDIGIRKNQFIPLKMGITAHIMVLSALHNFILLNTNEADAKEAIERKFVPRTISDTSDNEGQPPIKRRRVIPTIEKNSKAI